MSQLGNESREVLSTRAETDVHELYPYMVPHFFGHVRSNWRHLLYSNPSPYQMYFHLL